MTRVGCHVSIAGGIVNAPGRAAALGCESFQMFSRSPQGGPAPAITKEIIKQFRSEMEKHCQENCYIHTPYYINFASSNSAIRSSAPRIVREELERASLVGAKYIMTHLGSAKDMPREEALEITAKGVGNILKGYKGSAVLLLEISAGAGNIIGDAFDELGYIIDNCGYKNIGICLDTAHMFASGYDIKTKEGFGDVMKAISKTVGKESIKLVHANDSKIELGGRKDRHDHIGQGKIGESGFENLMSLLPGRDFICETEHDFVAKDIEILKKMRDFI